MAVFGSASGRSDLRQPAFGRTGGRIAIFSTAALLLAIACGQDATDDASGSNGHGADAGLGANGGTTSSGGSAGRGTSGRSGDAGSGGSGVAGSNSAGASSGGSSAGASTGGSSAGSSPGGAGSGGSSAGDAAGTGKYPLPALPPNQITDSILAQGESLYRTADDLRIAGNWTASFDTYLQLMRLLQGAVGPLASQAHRTMARAEHDLGGLSRWRIEKDIVIGLQHYRASVAHCDVGGCNAVAMGSVGRVTEFEQELSSMGQPIPPWNPPSY